MNIGLVEEDAALLAWRDQIKVDGQAEPAVEGDPVEDEVELVLDQEEDTKRRPVHEPWREHTRVGSAQGFVGEEDG